jgi:ABC-type phosphate transport system substrate-binding protein
MQLHRKKLGTLSLAAVAAMAAGGIGAGSAGASLLTPCTGVSPVHGDGSSLQGAAQTIWDGRFGITQCSGRSATYTVSSSGRGMNKWHADGTSPFDTSVHFVGTDDAPDSANFKPGMQDTVARGGGGSTIMTFPVAQSAVTVPVTLPSGCTLTQISAANLESVWDGTFTTWRQISTASPTTVGGACDVAINRIVRNDVSGTTFSFKSFLAQVDSTTWSSYLTAANNTSWPATVIRSQSGCLSTDTRLNCAGGLNSGSGGGDEVKTVSVATSAIGYAGLADARNQLGSFGPIHGMKWIKVGPVGGGTTQDPSTNGVSTTRANSNCPGSTSTGNYTTLPADVLGDWNRTILTSAGGAYPICILTYDLAYRNYTPAWGATNGPLAETSVKDFLTYVIGSDDRTAATKGQTDIASNDYAPLPQDVRGVAWAGLSLFQ